MNKETDSIVRYCKPSQVIDGVVQASAFLLRKKDPTIGRPKDEIDLSVDHFEHFQDTQFAMIRDELTLRGIEVKRNGWLAKVRYHELERDIEERLFINIDLIKNHGSHCLVKNLYQHDEEAAFAFLENINDQVKIEEIG